MSYTFTTNQIKSFAKNNPYIHSYLSKRKNHENDIYSKIGKNPTVKHSNGWHVDYITNKSNSLYFYAHKEFERKFNLDHYKTQLFFDVEIDFLQWNCILSFDISGSAKIEIRRCNIGKDKTFNKLPFINEYNYIFAYGGVLSTDAAKIAASQKINSFLYLEGYFRDLQYEFWANKERAKELYKMWIVQRKDTMDKFDVTATRKAIKRHLNLTTEYLSDEQFFNAAKKIAKRDKLTYVERFDTGFLNDFDGDVYELESLFYSQYDDDKIYI
jgi:hypothetical protein